MEEKKQEKKPYEKPLIEKHKSLAVISGSGSSCNYYSSKAAANTYYH